MQQAAFVRSWAYQAANSQALPTRPVNVERPCLPVQLRTQWASCTMRSCSMYSRSAFCQLHRVHESCGGSLL